MLNVLVVDDDTDLLEMVSLVLKSHDMKVECLNKGGLLFQSITTGKPDIVLMDIYLGDSDGRELCRELKSTRQFQNIPVILYSAGNINEASVQQSLADDFVSKPFDISQLVRKINSCTKAGN
jgi:DNA-binding response OmpR family regulator